MQYSSSIIFLCLISTLSPSFSQDWAAIRAPKNSALSLPLGQGLEHVHSAEPLGKGRFRLRLHNRSDGVNVPNVGKGSIYTGSYGFAYGLGGALDVGLGIPFLMDSIDGLNRYGTGDPVISIKLSRPSKVPSVFYVGYQLLFGLPLGYTGEHALDQFDGTRSFSSGTLDLGMQLLGDIHFGWLSVYLNGGYFRSGNSEVPTMLSYGVGTEIMRSNRWFSFNVEYRSQVSFSAKNEAQALAKAGVVIKPYDGIEIELNRQVGLLDHPFPSSNSFSLRLHGNIRGGRRLLSRTLDYVVDKNVRGAFNPVEMIRIAFVDFEGFEELNAGTRVVQKVRGILEGQENIEMIDIKRYSDIPHSGYLPPRDAVDLGRKLSANIVVTGVVDEFEVNRFGGPRIPFIFARPETEVKVGMRFRVIEIDDSGGKIQSQVYSAEGTTSKHHGVRVIPYERRNITRAVTASQMNDLQDAALDDLVGNLLASMAENSRWLEPESLQ